MTLMEALKTERQFRREGWTYWVFLPEDADYTLGLTRQDILAWDWEVLNVEG